MSDQWDDYDDDEDATCYHEELSEPDSEFRQYCSFCGEVVRD